MRKSFLALVSFVPFAALACPNLSGQFSCNDFDNGAVQDVTISQSDTGGVTTYHVKIVSDGKTIERDHVADGAVKSTSNDEFTTRTEKSYCDGNALKMDINGVKKANGDQLNATVTINLDAAGNMYDNYIGKEGNKTLNFEETCKRVK